MNQKEPYPLNAREKELLREEEKKLGRPLTELSGGPAYSMCFACGKENPLGLHLHFFSIPGGCLAFFTPSHEHQSYNDRMHGGLIMTLMDEVMGNYLFLNSRLYGKNGNPFPHARAHWRNSEGHLPRNPAERAPVGDGSQGTPRRWHGGCRSHVSYDV